MNNMLRTEFFNEKIALFMGYDVFDDEVFGKPIRVYSIKTNDSVDRALNRHLVSTLNYHTSWESLMPVVEKINSFSEDDIGITIGKSTVLFLNGKLERYTEETPILSTHKAVSKFLEIYEKDKVQSLG